MTTENELFHQYKENHLVASTVYTKLLLRACQVQGKHKDLSLPLLQLTELPRKTNLYM